MFHEGKQYVKMIRIGVVGLLGVCVFARAALSQDGQLYKGGRPTLQECYALALRQSETLAINKDLIDEAQARFQQALGTALPHVSIVSTDSLQEIGKEMSPHDTLFHSAHVFERKVVVTQTLFSGFKEFAGMKGSHLEKNQREKELKRAKQLLWVDMADAFYLFLSERRDLEELGNTKSVLEGRIKELEERERVGRSRKSEIVNTRSQLYALAAEVEGLKSRMQVARGLLEFLTGTPIVDVQDEVEKLPALLDQEQYLERSNARFDILALEDAFKTAQQQARIARSGFFPTLNLDGAYIPERNTAPEDSHWEANLTVTVPLFEGTETYGKLAQAKLQAHESELQLQRIKRLARNDARDAYVQAASEISRCNALKQALDASEENYCLQQEDYRFNLVSNLEVLNAIETLNDARRNYVQSYYDAKRLYEQLLVASGMVNLDGMP